MGFFLDRSLHCCDGIVAASMFPVLAGVIFWSPVLLYSGSHFVRRDADVVESGVCVIVVSNNAECLRNRR